LKGGSILKKVRILSILILIALVALAGCGASEPPPQEDPVEDVGDLFEKGRDVENLYYEIVIDAHGMQSEGKIWLTTNKMRMEMTVAGQTSITIIDNEAEAAFMYIPAENTAIRMPFAASEEDFSVKPGDFLDYDESLVTMGETVIYNGVECQKVSVQDDPPVTMWIHKQYGIPVRVEVDMGEDMMVWEFRNISIDPIPAEIFDLPEDVQIIG
jgi:outer membrane lipoprotein-sorting protein